MRGLLSMAFDPNYATNGLFYVFYTGTAAADGQEGLGHIDEFHVSANPNVADVASRRPVLTITPPSAMTHPETAGGQLQFGKDGLLYISEGDGGDPSTAPNLALLNGKVLRIDPHGTAPGQYSIPPSNPYVSSGTARHEIWASGFRNPWRFSFDRATGDLIIADVGEDASEEVDLAPASSGLGRAQTSAGRPARASRGAVPGRRLRSSPIRTPTPAATSPTAARSLAATSTAAPRSLSSPAAISTRTSAPASCARSGSVFRWPATIDPRARPAPWPVRSRSARTRAATCTSRTAMWWTSSSARHPPPLRPPQVQEEEEEEAPGRGERRKKHKKKCQKKKHKKKKQRK